MENGFIGGKKRCRRMYVQYLLVISCILTLGILTSCGGNAEKEEEIGISTVAYTEEAAEMEQGDTGDLWKKAYIDYIESCNQREIDSFDLIYLDDDDIPELVLVGKYSASGCIILNYADGKVHAANLTRLEFSYIERENLLLNCGGNTGAFFDDVYSILDGELVLVAKGDYDILSWEEAGEDGEEVPVCRYMWNAKTVSEDGYYHELNLIYDKSKARYHQSPGIPLDKITHAIMN